MNEDKHLEGVRLIPRLRIRHKLFFTLFVTSAVVAGGLFYFLQWNFDRGFLNYVQSQELERFYELASRLGAYYDEKHGWAEMEDNHLLWQDIHREVFETDRSEVMHDPHLDFREGGPMAGRLGRPSMPPGKSIHFVKRIVLFDANKNKVIGGPPGKDIQLTITPITKEKKTVGYLGLVPAAEFSKDRDLLFIKEQKKTFLFVALAMLVISLLFTFPVTIQLLRPINLLTEGAQKLIGGRFATRIPIVSQDELGVLSKHFNMLAVTLEENEKARQRWIADISHELRTPLSVLRGELEALLDGVRQTEPKALEPLHHETLHLQRLVNDLYELSMSDIGALTYKKIEVDPIGILEDGVEVFAKKFKEKKLVLNAYFQECETKPVLADPDRIQQLFTNILENGLRYTDCPGMMEILVENTQEEVVILFQDSSPGVTEEQLPLLFDRLYRTDPSRNREHSGAGLGLSICANIVDAHEGQISSYHSPHGGLGIEVRLPVSQQFNI